MQSVINLQELETTLGINYAASIQQPIEHPLLEQHDVAIEVKRDDLLHPVVSGNKWRKLKYCIHDALCAGHEHIVSMGGAWSNHLHALAYAGKALGIKTTGLIRGEEQQVNTPTLQDCQDWGMQLQFVERTTFRQLREYRHHADPPAQTYNGYWLPEGGASTLALKGISELAREIDTGSGQVFVACGTGTTLAGLIAGAGTYPLTGIAVLRAESFMQKDINTLLGNQPANHSWSLNFDYHCGGYARSNAALDEFVHDFELQTAIPVEPVYTGKLFYALFSLIEQGSIASGSRIVALHSGGLQGKRNAV